MDVVNTENEKIEMGKISSYNTWINWLYVPKILNVINSTFLDNVIKLVTTNIQDSYLPEGTELDLI